MTNSTPAEEAVGCGCIVIITIVIEGIIELRFVAFRGHKPFVQRFFSDCHLISFRNLAALPLRVASFHCSTAPAGAQEYTRGILVHDKPIDGQHIHNVILFGR